MMLVSQRKMKQIGFFALCILLVFGFYETVVKMENGRRGNIRSRLIPNNEDRPLQESLENYEDSSIVKNQVNDLAEANKKIQQLDEKLRNIEAKVNNRIPKNFPTVKFLNYKNRKRILVTGGAGFVGSHLVDRLMLEGHEVIVADNFFTGRKRNVEHWDGHENFELVHHDIVRPLYLEVDEIYHLASPASPPHYMLNPVKTLKTNTIGTINMLGLAKRVGARVLIASTSEVYGDPMEHPQSETYWGHVNPIGPRACYDEGKRVAETLSYSYMRQEGVDVRVARIFNTFGPRMHMNDGRVVSNFILQALQNDSITIYGNGKQTRSFQYVSDLVDGLVALMSSNYTQPINLGNPVEHTIEEFAIIIKNLVGGTSKIIELAAVEDDPQRRRPNISRAKRFLNWEPKVSLTEGLTKTISYFEKELKKTKHSQGDVVRIPYVNDHDIVEQL
ncbi:UDP-glucuronic acid decarboxylase 1 [Fopius arisanus]|uniref:UDP-glucuronic acid decarboxylase 1 n=1 Tax=Fopius arisanus TaxID=64838 RepID=A0A9R1TD62_9HYME|nr:PREDICTED: UDP-glucuronic acid decarboxylase 1 [Fopius arisanus]